MCPIVEVGPQGADRGMFWEEPWYIGLNKNLTHSNSLASTIILTFMKQTNMF